MVSFESAVAETTRTPTRNRSRSNSDAASEEQEILRTDIVNEVDRPDHWRIQRGGCNPPLLCNTQINYLYMHAIHNHINDEERFSDLEPSL